MTRLEELTALLVNEINTFNQSVEKLERINSELKTTKIKMDLTEYKSIIESHQNQMDKHQRAIELFEERFNNKIREARIYPNWAVIIFIMVILFLVASLLYAYRVKAL